MEALNHVYGTYICVFILETGLLDTLFIPYYIYTAARPERLTNKLSKHSKQAGILQITKWKS
jgi:hypothetical protein